MPVAGLSRAAPARRAARPRTILAPALTVRRKIV